MSNYIWIFWPESAVEELAGWYKAKKTKTSYIYTKQWQPLSTKTIRKDSQDEGVVHDGNLRKVTKKSEGKKSGDYITDYVFKKKTMAKKQQSPKVDAMDISPIALQKPKTPKPPKTENFRVKWLRHSRPVATACLKGYEIKKMLGKGTFGVVHEACEMEDQCDYTFKMLDLLGIESTEEDYIKEVNTMEMLSNGYDIGPKFFKSWVCDDVAFIVTEKWDSSLPVNVCVPANLIEKLINQIGQLHALGLVHGDILEKNVLVKMQKNKITDITLTDFGSIQTAKDWQADPQWILTYYGYHHNAGLHAYYKDNGISSADVINDPTHLDRALVYKLKKICNK